MNILVYRWYANTEKALIKYMKRLGISVVEYDRKMKDYHADSDFALGCMQLIEKEQIDAVFSFDYFPLLSMICKVREIPYLSWIYDCPMLTLQSKTISNACNYIFCFDELYAQRLILDGAGNCFHMLLAGDPDLLTDADRAKRGSCRCDISFLGNLYNGEKNRFRQAEWAPYEKGFFEGLINAQSLVYGLNFVKQTLDETLVDTILTKCRIEMGEMYRFDAQQMAADVINGEISARDRESVLDIVSRKYELELYSTSKLPAALQGRKSIHQRGYADYHKVMPHIFHESNINLNITSRTIESGIPLRIFDILSCGGFCLTNYQPEVAKYFEDGVDLVMYTDMQDLMDKVEYYLSHEEERQQIAENGFKRIREEYNYTAAIELMLETAGLKVCQ